MLLVRRGVCIIQKSWLILPNHPIACTNMGLKIGYGKWILYRVGALLSDGADSILRYIV